MITFGSLMFGNWKYVWEYKNPDGIKEIIMSNDYQDFLQELKRFGQYDNYINELNAGIPDKEHLEQYTIFDYIK